MSLVSIIGPRPNLFDLEGTLEHQASGSAPADPRPTRIWRRSARSRRWSDDHFKSMHARQRRSPASPSPARRSIARAAAAVRVRAEKRRARRHQHHHPFGPHGGATVFPMPSLLRLRGGASSPNPRKACARRSALWSSPASRAKCTALPASPVMARRRSIPISHSRSLSP